MSTLLNTIRSLLTGRYFVYLVFPVFFAMGLCVCSIETVQAQKNFTRNQQGLVEIEVETSSAPMGAKVVSVVPKSYAEQAGIKTGNIIVSINKTRITSSADFYQLTAKLSPNTFVDVGVIQNNIKVTRGVRVGSLTGSSKAVSSREKVLPFNTQFNNGPNLDITSLEVSQNIIAPGAVFEILMDLFAENIQEQDEVRITMIYTIKKGGKSLIVAEPETLTLPNGIPVSIIRHCRAQKEKGNYEVSIQLEMANVKAEKSVEFIVK